MNKLLILIIGLFVISPVIGMDLITKEDSVLFGKAISAGIDYDKKMIQENKISHNNPIHMILKKLSRNFDASKRDLTTFIKKHSLQYRLNEYTKIDSSSLMQLALKQVYYDKNGYTDEIRKYVIQTRGLFAQLELQKKQPSFRLFVFGGTRLEFMLDNQHYPVNEAAFNDYVAWAIYTYILAGK